MATVLTGMPSAAATSAPAADGQIFPSTTIFGGLGTGATAEAALDDAVADATAQAAAARFGDYAITGDPIVQSMVRPGFPVTYRAQVTVGCTT
ncbi:hypothetical protein [Nonomuraea rosea]|uniref:hypothetical protein n=1 Tax=Nonomuraea rosea TaxID=638574 RepID=UPI0031EA3128